MGILRVFHLYILHVSYSRPSTHLKSQPHQIDRMRSYKCAKCHPKWSVLISPMKRQCAARCIRCVSNVKLRPIFDWSYVVASNSNFTKSQKQTNLETNPFSRKKFSNCGINSISSIIFEMISFRCSKQTASKKCNRYMIICIYSNCFSNQLS